MCVFKYLKATTGRSEQPKTQGTNLIIVELKAKRNNQKFIADLLTILSNDLVIVRVKGRYSLLDPVCFLWEDLRCYDRKVTIHTTAALLLQYILLTIHHTLQAH